MSNVNWLAIIRIMESIARDTGSPLPEWVAIKKAELVGVVA